MERIWSTRTSRGRKSELVQNALGAECVSPILNLDGPNPLCLPRRSYEEMTTTDEEEEETEGEILDIQELLVGGR